MALIKAVKGIIPNIGKRCFLADNATIIGDVVLGMTAASGSMP